MPTNAEQERIEAGRERLEALRRGDAQDVAAALTDLRRSDPQLFQVPFVFVSPQARIRHHVSWLDPVEAERGERRRATHPTGYRRDRLLVRGDGAAVAHAVVALGLDDGRVVEVRRRNEVRDLTDVVDTPEPGKDDRDWPLPTIDDDVAKGLDEDTRRRVTEAWERADVTVLQVESGQCDRGEPLDAWDLVQSLSDQPDLPRVHLAHIHGVHEASAHPMTSHPMTSHPMTSHPMTSHPMTSHSGNGVVARYAVPGMGGRTPVDYPGRLPDPRPLRDEERAPVVLIADTAIGRHRWLPDAEDGDPAPGTVRRNPRIGGGDAGPLLGPPFDAADVETDARGWSNPLVGALDTASGHATFMAGLVRQACPTARLLGVRLFGGDGVIDEGEIVLTLQRILLRQVTALLGKPYLAIDVVCLSLGTYHESPEDAQVIADMAGPLRALGVLGVTVVASAGNDATMEPAFPAAYAPGGLGLPADPDVAPQVTVGATNPDVTVLADGTTAADGTAALFSNEGPWVGQWQPGVALVSTYPESFDGSVTDGVTIVSPLGRPRSGFDLDDYAHGFAVWSGTSFAAPAFAGRLVEWFISGGRQLSRKAHAGRAVRRSWEAVGALTELTDPGAN